MNNALRCTLRMLLVAVFMGAMYPAAARKGAGKYKEIVSQVFAAINDKREAAGKAPLQIESTLNEIAEKHSENMAAHKVAFGHGGFDGRFDEISERWAKIAAMAENVSMDVNAAAAVEAWWRSAGHHKNILGAYTHTGIGVAKGSDGYYYITQIFVRRQ